MAATPLRFGIEVVNLGDLANPRAVLRLARAAESAGWEMLVVWDHLAFVWSVASGAPWITLAGVAAVTERLRLGTGVLESLHLRRGTERELIARIEDGPPG